MRYLIPTGLALLAGCAFEAGPARRIPMEIAPEEPGTVVTDLGWRVRLEEARLFVHRIAFLSGETAAGAGGHTHAHLTAALTDQATGTARFVHGAAEPAAASDAVPVGELVVDAVVDLLADPVEAGEAVFALGAEAAEARILVAPPEETDDRMHDAGLYLAGTAVGPGGTPVLPFTAALPVGTDLPITGLSLHADRATELHLEIHLDAWFDGIDFAELRTGEITDGTEAAELLEHRLGEGTFHLHVHE